MDGRIQTDRWMDGWKDKGLETVRLKRAEERQTDTDRQDKARHTGSLSL